MSTRIANKLMLDLLKDSQLMESLKCEIRRKLISNQLKKETLIESPNLSDLDVFLHGIIVDFLEYYKYSFSLSVFVPESKITFSPSTLTSTMHMLGLQCNTDVYDESLCTYKKYNCVLKVIFISLKKLFSKVYCDKSCETDSDNSYIDDNNALQVKQEFEEKLKGLKHNMQVEYEERINERIEQLKALYKAKSTIENQKLIDDRIKEKTIELENIYKVKLNSLHERQRIADECLTKYKNSESTEAYLRRQINLAECDAIKMQKENIAKAWIDIDKKKSENESYFNDKFNQLNIEKEELKMKYLLFSEEVNQNVEQLRKVDSLRIQKTEKELEVLSENLNGERISLKEKKEQLLKFSEELNHKSSLLSQAELVSYENLNQVKENLAEECKVIKSELKSARKEISGLKINESRLLVELNELRSLRDNYDNMQTSCDQNNISLIHQINTLNEEISRLKLENQDLKINLSHKDSSLKLLETNISNKEKRETVKQIKTYGEPYKAPVLKGTTSQPDKWMNKLDVMRQNINELDKESNALENNFKSWRDVMTDDFEPVDNIYKPTLNLTANNALSLPIYKLPLESYTGTCLTKFIYPNADINSLGFTKTESISKEKPHATPMPIKKSENNIDRDMVERSSISKTVTSSNDSKTQSNINQVDACELVQESKKDDLNKISNSETVDYSTHSEEINDSQESKEGNSMDFNKFVNRQSDSDNEDQRSKKSLDIKFEVGEEFYSDERSQTNDDKSDSFW